MPRPILATVSASAIDHNLRVAKRHAPGARIWGVIKANAYGHGLQRALAGLRSADGLAMLDLDEAVFVRRAGWDRPVLLLEGFFGADDLQLVCEHQLTTVVHCNEQLEWLAAIRPEHPVDIYLKLNSGMNRLGFAPDAYREAYRRLRALPAIGAITLMTHFADADGAGGVATQLASFGDTTAGLPGERSMSNSAATLVHAQAHGDWVRPGVMLYGASPFAERSAASFGLRAAMTLESRLIGIQQLRRGDAVGYGGHFVADRPMRIGVVACGYADGYPRVAPDGTPVIVDGQRTRLIGRVSMDMITVDLSGMPDAKVGTPVELWGDQLAVDEVAHAAGTIGYELLCALAPRVPVRTAS